MATNTRFDIDQLFKGYLDQLKAEAEYFTNSVDHRGEKGRLNETHFASILRRYLPNRFGIGTGFVVSANPEKKISPQCDIIIYDAQNHAPFYESKAFSIYPVEIVYGVIEVKTSIYSKAEIDDCFNKCAFLRKMAQEYISYEKYMEDGGGSRNDFRIDHEGRYARSFKNYLRYESDGTKSYYMHLSPRFFIFAYRGHAKAKSFEKHFDAATARCADAHVHGACLLGRTGGGFYTGHFAYRKVGERVAPVVSRDGFREFLFSLPRTLDTMLLPIPLRSGNGFDMIDPRRYLTMAPDIELELQKQPNKSQ
jgi:hypothetical protein